jgi:hypothetical protein
LSGVTEWLARKSAGDNIDPRQVVALSDVGESLRVGEMSLKYPPAKWINLNLPNCLDARPLETKVKSADATE